MFLLFVSIHNVVKSTKRVPYNVDDVQGAWSSTIPGSGVGQVYTTNVDSNNNNDNLDSVNQNNVDAKQGETSLTKEGAEDQKDAMDNNNNNINSKKINLAKQDAAGRSMRFSRTKESMSMRKGKGGGGAAKKKKTGILNNLAGRLVKKVKCGVSKKLGKFGKNMKEKHCPKPPAPKPKPTAAPTAPEEIPEPVTEAPLQPAAPTPSFVCSKDNEASFLQISEVVNSNDRTRKIDLTFKSSATPFSSPTNMRFSQTRVSMSMRKGKGGDGDKKKEKSGLGKALDKGIDAVKTNVKNAVKKAVTKAKCAVGKKLPFGLGKNMQSKHCPKPKPPVKTPTKPVTPTKPGIPTKPKPPTNPQPVVFGPVSPIKQTWADVEACEACKFVWDSVATSIAQMDYDSVASAFDDVCNEQPEIFATPCEEMRRNLNYMIEDYLKYKNTISVCSCAGMFPCDKVRL